MNQEFVIEIDPETAETTEQYYIKIAPETAETTEQDDIKIKIELSPNGKYLVTHNRGDRSIVGWNVEDIDEGRLKQDHISTVKLVDAYGSHKNVIQICVSDDKKLAFIYNYADLDKTFIDIIDMNKERENWIKLELYPHDYYYRPYHCTFNLEGDFILYSEVDKDYKNYDNDDKKIIWVYSTRTNKNNEWICKGIHKIPENFELISISKYDKLYLFSNNYFYEWDMRTEKSIRILANKYEEEQQHEYRIQRRHKYKVKIKMTSNKKFICLRTKDKIIIYSIELEIPIVEIDNDIQLYNFMKYSELYPLLPSLFDLFDYTTSYGIWNPVIKHCLEECLDRKKEEDKFKESLPKNIKIGYLKKGAIEYAFGILGGYVWKFKFEELKNVNLYKLNKEYTKLNKNWNIVRSDSDELNKKNDKMIKDERNNENEIIKGWNFYLDSNELNNKNENEIIESQNICLDSDELNNEDDRMIDDFDKKTYDINIHLFSPYMDSIRELLENAITNTTTNTSAKEKNNLIKWKVRIDDGKILLRVFKKVKYNDEWYYDYDPITTKIMKIENYHTIIASSLLNNNDIVILTTLGLFIFCFFEYKKSISLSYVYSMNLFFSEDRENNLREYQKEFLKDTLPLPNIEFILYLKENKENLLKYGVELLSFAIVRHDVYRIEKIYKNCIKYFNEDLENNRKFLSIITSTIPLLNKHYPEYISRFSLDTNMIIDSSSYNVGHRSSNRHLYSFSQDPQLINLTSSISWTKYNYQLRKIKENSIFSLSLLIQYFIQLLIILLTLPIFFPIFYYILKHHFINNIYHEDLFSKFYNICVYFYTSTINYFNNNFTISEQLIPTITFMFPYIKFVNYSQHYNWFWDWIKPQPNMFVETKNSKEIYKTLSGEALINFKWNAYGKYYYYAIWIGYITLLVCFTIATHPQKYIIEDIRKPLLFVSIILGFIFLSYEIRVIIYDPNRWFHDPWNWFDIIVYVLPMSISTYLLKTNNKNEQIVQLISYSCLLLDLRLLLFFKVLFRRFGIYFSIIVKVAKKVYIFLVIFIAIMMMSFAHAFYILLSPKLDYSLDEYTINNDSNNPWNLASTYNQVFDNGTVNPNPFIIQPPNENTNMFTNYGNAIFAVSLFFTGDTSLLSNWSYEKNPILMILMTLFTFLTVIYILNVFIGLFSEVMQFDNAEASMLIMKAEILAKIELFYLLPHQRRWKEWFPEIIHYYANFDKVRKKVIKDKEWDNEINQNLLKILNIEKTADNNEVLLKKLLERVENLENIVNKY